MEVEIEREVVDDQAYEEIRAAISEADRKIKEGRKAEKKLEEAKRAEALKAEVVAEVEAGLGAPVDPHNGGDEPEAGSFIEVEQRKICFDALPPPAVRRAGCYCAHCYDVDPASSPPWSPCWVPNRW